ncbi:MAG: hypothetical protein WCI49_08080 [Ferruginibacter sp.]
MLVSKSKYLYSSLWLNLLSIVTTLLINYQIAKEYLNVHGKTRALFGIKELLQFGYQYWVALAGIIALILAIIGIVKSSASGYKWTVILLSLLSIALVFARVWRVFI